MSNLSQLTPQEIEFFALNKIVTIIPNFFEQQIELVEGTFGPFKIDNPIEVPLWLGVFLQRWGKCQIQIREEYSQEYLELKINEEKQNHLFSELPEWFFEIFHILYEECKENFSNPVQIKSLIEDLKQVRLSKITNQIKKMEVQEDAFLMNNITTYEIGVFWPLLTESFGMVAKNQKIGMN